MKQIAPEQKLILLIAPVRRGRPQQSAAYPFMVILIYLYLEKLAEELFFKSNAIQYAGDWDGFASSMASFDTWSGVITSGAGSLVTNSLNLATIGDNGVKVTGFSSLNINDMQSLNSVVGGLASSGLEYALTGKTTLNILNIADIGVNSLVNRAIGNSAAPPVKASCGLLELHLDESQGASFALGTNGTDLGLGTVSSALRGFDALKTNFEINHYTNKNDLQNAAIALREQYGFGGKTENKQLKEILTGKTELKAGSGPGNAQTVTENDKRIVYLNGYSDNMTKEEQMKLGITLGHEAYRDGIKGDDLAQKLETREAVAGHTDLMTRMLGDDLYTQMMSGIIADDTNLQMDLLARTLGDEVFNSYVDGMYDSSADYWKFTKEGNIVWDGSKNLYDEDGQILHVYSGDGGNTAALAEGLGISEYEAGEMLKAADYRWNSNKHNFVDKNGNDVTNVSSQAVITDKSVKNRYDFQHNYIDKVFEKYGGSMQNAHQAYVTKQLEPYEGCWDTPLSTEQFAGSIMIASEYLEFAKKYDEAMTKYGNIGSTNVDSAIFKEIANDFDKGIFSNDNAFFKYAKEISPVIGYSKPTTLFKYRDGKLHTNEKKSLAIDYGSKGMSLPLVTTEQETVLVDNSIGYKKTSG